MKYEFTIGLVPITKKNSQKIIWQHGRPLIVQSDKYRQYERDAAVFVPPLGITGRVNVKAVFYMPTKRRVDLVNLLEALCDVLVRWGAIEDDSAKYIVSMDGSRVEYDKENPRTEITIDELD